MPFKYLASLIKHAFKYNKIIAVLPFFALITVLFELFALVTLYPLLDIEKASHSRFVTGIKEVIPGFEVVNLIHVFFGCVLIKICMQIFYNKCSIACAKSLLCNLATSCFEKITRDFPLTEIFRSSIGHYVALAGDESFRASNLVIDMAQGFVALFMTIIYFGSLYYISSSVSIGAVAFFGLVSIFILCLMQTLRKLGEQQINQSKIASSVFLDSLNGIRTVRCFQAESYVTQSYLQRMQKYTNTLFKIDFYPVLIRFVPLLLLIATGWGGVSIYQSQAKFDAVHIPYLIAVVFCLIRLLPSAGQLMNIFMRIYSEAKVGQDVTRVINYVAPQSSADKVLAHPIKTLKLKQVTFAYNKNDLVLDGLSVAFHVGQSYAIVGHSGAGKSTLLNILAQLMPYSGGEILINNTNVNQYQKESVRKQILMVEQNVTIFNDTIFNNITLGKDVTIDEVRHVAKICMIDDFVLGLESDYATVLDYQGTNLSGGQRQRLSITRALLRNPDVLLFDEITSALDAKTCMQIIKNIKHHFCEKIMIFVTHDEKIAKYVDTCYVFKNGKLAHESSKEPSQTFAVQ